LGQLSPTSLRVGLRETVFVFFSARRRVSCLALPVTAAGFWLIIKLKFSD